jgi:hypothetical protein
MSLLENIKSVVSHPVACLIEGFSVGVSLGWYACQSQMATR